jgi:DNA-binding FadR family transcriptional regulator
MRLPPERDLARMLAASRPTLREALRKLGEWGLIDARRGSGISVREIESWSLDVLPAYLRIGRPPEGAKALLRTVRDLLDLRKLLLLDVLKLVAPRLDAGALASARAAVDRAWAARHDIATFIREDFAMVRGITHAARLLPAVWMLNSVANVYVELAKPLTGAATVPDDYRDSLNRVLDALERGDGDAAHKEMSRYLENHDRRVMAALEVFR